MPCWCAENPEMERNGYTCVCTGKRWLTELYTTHVWSHLNLPYVFHIFHKGFISCATEEPGSHKVRTIKYFVSQVLCSSLQNLWQMEMLMLLISFPHFQSGSEWGPGGAVMSFPVVKELWCHLLHGLLCRLPENLPVFWVCSHLKPSKH